jgi:PKD repeat protein
VELALLLPILMTLLVGAGDLARVFAARMTVASAARAGAMEAAQHPTSWQAGAPCDATTNRVMCAVLTESRGGTVEVDKNSVSLVCTPSPCAGFLGNRVDVSVASSMSLLTPLLVPFFGGSTIPISSTASAQIAVRPNIVPAATATPSPTPAPTPTPTASPTPGPTATPGPTGTPTPDPSPTPTPSPTPYCPPPTAAFWANPSTGRHQDPFSFFDTSFSWATCPVTGWSWNFGDGAGQASTSSLQNPTHEYAHKGTYTITLVASNAGGADTKTMQLVVNP